MEYKLPNPSPIISADTAGFWAATTRGILVLQRCAHCMRVIWYPKAFCNECGSFDLDTFEASGKGEIYSYTNVHRGETAYREVPSFILALVELDEGVRMLTNIVEYTAEELRVGQRVEVVFHDTGDGSALPRFRPLKRSA